MDHRRRRKDLAIDEEEEAETLRSEMIQQVRGRIIILHE